MSARYPISSAAVHVITGSLGDDPMQWATQSGVRVAVFSVKVVRQVKLTVAEEVQTEYHTTWYRIKTFGTTATACLRYLHKDRLVQVQGSEMKAWGFIDPKTGEPRGALELIANSVIFLDPPNVGLAGSNVLPLDDIDFSFVEEVEAAGVEVEELALAG